MECIGKNSLKKTRKSNKSKNSKNARKTKKLTKKNLTEFLMYPGNHLNKYFKVKKWLENNSNNFIQ